MLASTMSVRQSRWRETFGFFGNPFEQYQAELEKSFLPYCFVDRPYLHNILGDPAYPQTAILSARPGEGKTATREMIVYECLNGKMRGKALPVCYDEFENLRPINTELSARDSLQQHVFGISRLLLETVRKEVPPTYFERLDSFDASLLLSLAHTYASSVTSLWLRRVLPKAEVMEGAAQGLTPGETLNTLVSLVCSLGISAEDHYQAVYILVDRVDEICPGDPQSSIQAIRALVSENALINREKLAFKFFLPVEFTPAVHAMLPIAPQKVISESIDWNPQLLPMIINQRLEYFSQGTLNNYEQLFASDLRRQKTIDRLMDEADASPRALIRLFNYMVQSHLQRDEAVGTSLLDRLDLRNALSRLEEDGSQARGGGVQPILQEKVPLVHAVPAIPPGAGLHIDANGKIFIDGQMLKSDLSRSEFALLKELHKHNSNIVTTEQLIYAVWPESRASSEDPKGDKYDEQNLRKLIDRLREKLTLDANQEKDRFIRNARGRGYWLSYT